MKKYFFLCGLLLSILTLSSMKLKAQQTIRVIDGESKVPVAYAILSSANNNIKSIADIDGLLNININEKENYTFSRLGYKDINISGEQLNKKTIIMLELLPIELSPITVTANKALLELNNAISNTYKSLPQPPFHIKSFQQDKIIKNNLTVVNANAIFVTKISRIFEMGRGCSTRLKLKGLKTIFYEKNFNLESVEKFTYYEIPFVNAFLFGHNKKDDNNLSFYHIDVNDSILIIGYAPKLKFIPHGYILTSGRFIIDKREWKLIRIDSEVNPRMLNFQNEKVLDDQKKNMLYQKFIRSIYFSKNGLPAKLEERLEYTLKNDTKKLIRENITTHIYKLITEKEFDAVPMKKTERKSILFQKPYFTPTFDAEFNEGFQ